MTSLRSLGEAEKRRLVEEPILRHFAHHAIRAWLWVAGEADTLEEKRRCLKAVLQLDPDNEPASLALLLLDQERPTS